MSGGLFDFADEANINVSGNASKAVYQPLADRMRPKELEDVLGQEDILGQDKPLRMLMEAGLSGSIILWGPPGCGKTTLARVLASHSDSEFIQLSAVTSGVKDMKAAFDQALYTRKTSGRKTILFIDEIHRFNKAQQDALLPHIESGVVVFIGATTENPSFEVNSALLSRCQVLVLKPVSVPALMTILYRAIVQDEKLNRAPKIDISEKSIERISMMAAGDARIALNVLETCCEVARQKSPEKPVVSPEVVAETFQSKLLRYDKGGDEHAVSRDSETTQFNIGTQTVDDNLIAPARERCSGLVGQRSAVEIDGGSFQDSDHLFLGRHTVHKGDQSYKQEDTFSHNKLINNTIKKIRNTTLQSAQSY